MTNIAFRSIGTVNTSNSGVSSAAVATPSGFAAGDILLASFSIANFSGSSTTFPTTVPSGWSTLGTQTTPALMGSAVYYKIASGSEGATQTWSGFSSGSSFWHHRMVMMAFTGGDATTPIPAGEWSKTTAANTTALQTHPTVTPTVAGSGLVLFRTMYNSTAVARSFVSSITSASSPAGVERSDPNASGNVNYALYTRDGGFSLTGQSYTTTANSTGSGNGQHMWAITLRADASGPTISDSVGVLVG